MAEPTLLTVEAFCCLVGAAPGEIDDLIARGVVYQPQPGQIGLVAGVGAYIVDLKARARNATLLRAATAARNARAEASELALAAAHRELIPDEEAETAVDFLCAVITRELTGLPARATRDLRSRSAMEAALRAAMTDLATGLEKA